MSSCSSPTLWQEDTIAEAALSDVIATEIAPNARFDIIVVGSGYAGLAAALRAARLGASVLLLESGDLAGGASSRNGGTYGPGLPIALLDLMQQFDGGVARELWELSMKAAALVELLAKETGIDCQVRRTGTVKLALRPAHYEAMCRYADWAARTVGAVLTPLGRDALLESEIGEGPFYGGLLDASSGQLHPFRFAAGLAVLAHRAGAVLLPNTPVAAISRIGNAFDVRTPRGSFKASRVLVTTGEARDNLLPRFQHRMVALGSYLVATVPLQAAVRATLFPKQRTFSTSRRLFNYFRLDEDDRFLFGGRNTLVPDLSEAGSRHALHAAMTALFPALSAVPITHAWGGRLAFFVDRIPRLGAFGGVYYALGFGGHGVTLATIGGTAAATMALGGPRCDSFELPLPVPPLVPANRFALRLLGYYYDMLDRVC